MFPIWHQSFSLCLHRTHLSWSVCPSPSPRKRAWHVSVLVKTTVERRATSPCNHPLHHRPPAVLLTHTRHRRVKKAREGWKEATDRRGEKKRERKGLWESLWDVWALFFQWDSVLLCSSRHIQTRTWKSEQRWEDRGEKWTSVKCPVLNLYGTKTSYLFFFSISNFSHCFLLFSGVFVNGHLYVNMKNQDQVLIDGLLENHVGLAFVWERRTWEILPWLSFNLLISRLSTSLCMVSGRCCISLKTKSWREDSYCVKEKKHKRSNNYLLVLFLANGYFSRGNSNSIHPLRLWSWPLWREPAFAGLLDTDHYEQLQVRKEGATRNPTRTLLLRWLDWHLITTKNVKCGKHRCKKTL